jgi:hypothetical protein
MISSGEDGSCERNMRALNKDNEMFVKKQLTYFWRDVSDCEPLWIWFQKTTIFCRRKAWGQDKIRGGWMNSVDSLFVDWCFTSRLRKNCEHIVCRISLFDFTVLVFVSSSLQIDLYCWGTGALRLWGIHVQQHRKSRRRFRCRLRVAKYSLRHPAAGVFLRSLTRCFYLIDRRYWYWYWYW